MSFKERELDLTLIEIQAKNSKQIIVGSLYRPPNTTECSLVDDLNELSHKVKQKKEMILGMDHNLNLLKSSEHKLTLKSLDCLLEQDILPTIMRPTRITKNVATLIDNICVK